MELLLQGSEEKNKTLCLANKVVRMIDSQVLIASLSSV